MIFWACWASSIAWSRKSLPQPLQALAVEVDRDAHVQRVRRELVADLGDEQLAQVAVEHRMSSRVGVRAVRPGWARRRP